MFEFIVVISVSVLMQGFSGQVQDVHPEGVVDRDDCPSEQEHDRGGYDPVLHRLLCAIYQDGFHHKVENIQGLEDDVDVKAEPKVIEAVEVPLVARLDPIEHDADAQDSQSPKKVEIQSKVAFALLFLEPSENIDERIEIDKHGAYLVANVNAAGNQHASRVAWA